MLLVDSHCHLDRLLLSDYGLTDLRSLLMNAKTRGVHYFLTVSVRLDAVVTVLNIAEQFDCVSASVGLHPTEWVAEEPTVEQLITWADHPKVVAIGETGLDYYHADCAPEIQQQRFRTHIRAAKLLKKPLIVHTRKARQDTLRILLEENARDVGGVLHCFTEDLAMARVAIERDDFHISFSGILTFKNARELQDIACVLPLERLLIETDAPYLAPMPFRGKPNQPAYVYYVAERLASLRAVSIEMIAEQTTDNFFNLFKIKYP